MNRKAETNINKQGYRMAISAYRSASDISVMFEDGQECRNVRYLDFKKGNVEHPGEPKGQDRIGAMSFDIDQQPITLTEYRSDDDITVKYEDGDQVSGISLDQFMNGTVHRETADGNPFITEMIRGGS